MSCFFHFLYNHRYEALGEFSDSGSGDDRSTDKHLDDKEEEDEKSESKNLMKNLKKTKLVVLQEPLMENLHIQDHDHVQKLQKAV